MPMGLKHLPHHLLRLPHVPPRVESVLPQFSPIQVTNTEYRRVRYDHLVMFGQGLQNKMKVIFTSFMLHKCMWFIHWVFLRNLVGPSTSDMMIIITRVTGGS